MARCDALTPMMIPNTSVPGPVFRKMTDRDLMAVYEYLRSIPSIEGGGGD